MEPKTSTFISRISIKKYFIVLKDSSAYRGDVNYNFQHIRPETEHESSTGRF